MNRLTVADVAGGAGGYGDDNEAHDFAQDTGNLATKSLASYNYLPQASSCPGEALSKVHAVVCPLVFVPFLGFIEGM